ncbi:MAG TPA: SAM-dependent methyltransferase [Beijerinckiaceae bacterium]|nr:SAM-dependent methyltransferase [Beijerinckiaceae bacterium]
MSGVSLEQRRRRYAAEITRHGGIYHERVEEAFATTPRENFLTPPPWMIFAPGGLFNDETSDPVELYQDVLVVLDRSRGINNGQPSLHAAWMAALDPQPGETVLHIGAGTGYYTAILAQLVTPGGRVHAYEIEEDLAEVARVNLAAFEGVTVHAASGVGTALPDGDVVYVNASASAPDIAWLEALKPSGRLIFPWQAVRQRGGIALQVTRTTHGYRAAAIMEVAFIPCVGAMSDPASGAPARTRDVMETRSIWLSRERPPDDSAIVVYDQVWLSSQAI